jgi:hypothetical protein
VGDFNGDGKADIIGRYRQTGQWWVAQSTGSLFVNSLWATWNPKVTWVDVQVGPARLAAFHYKPGAKPGAAPLKKSCNWPVSAERKMIHVSVDQVFWSFADLPFADK